MFELRFDMSEVSEALSDTVERARQLAPAFRDLKRPLKSDQRDHAKSESGPGGKWAPRSAATLERRKLQRRRGRMTKDKKAALALISFKPLKRRRGAASNRILGRLPTAMKTEIAPLYIRIVSRVKWSLAHAKGARVGRGVRLPAREFYWLSKAIVDLAAEKIGKYVVKGMKK